MTHYTNHSFLAEVARRANSAARRKLRLQWQHEEITETAFCVAYGRLIDCTEGEVRDMIDNFEV